MPNNRQIIAIVNGIGKFAFPTFTLRVERMLEEISRFGVEVLVMTYQQYLSQTFNSDFLVIQRFISAEVGRSLPLADAIINKATAEGALIIYDLDDDFENMSEFMRLQFTNEILVYESIKPKANIITVSTKNLQEAIGLQYKTFLLNNFFLQDPTHLKARKPRHNLVLGYIGNSDRLLDLVSVLIWFSDHFGSSKQITLETLGFRSDILNELETIFPSISFKNFDALDYSKLHTWIADRRWTASLAPLASSSFNEAKSLIKLIDYSWNLAPIGASEVGEAAELFGEHSQVRLLPPVDQKQAKSKWINWIQGVVEEDPLVHSNDGKIRDVVLKNHNSGAARNRIEDLWIRCLNLHGKEI
jgi:hypothetical protein